MLKLRPGTVVNVVNVVNLPETDTAVPYTREKPNYGRKRMISSNFGTISSKIGTMSSDSE